MTYTTISETVAAYDSMLDECYPDLTIAGYVCDTARALDQLDPIAYKCGWLDWCDSEGIDTDDLEDDYTFSRDRM
jgi:hypothetical protein